MAKSNFKTPLIVLITFIALFACIFLALKLISTDLNAENDEINETEAPNTPNETLILRAIDGDTLELSTGEIIRLLCVDTPELGETGYEEATNFLAYQVTGDIRIERQGFDKYNRTLAWVYSGETLVNKEVIDNGYGDVFEYEGTDCGRVR